MTTMVAAERGIKADVIIRATGTGWPLRIKRFPPPQEDTARNEILVVDFQDGFHAGAQRNTELRKADYLRRGYQVVDQNAGA